MLLNPAPTALEYLDLGSNYITGTLPESLGNLASLRLINLGKNGWTDKNKCGCAQAA
jgi:hypothetical protein